MPDPMVNALAPQLMQQAAPPSASPSPQDLAMLALMAQAPSQQAQPDQNQQMNPYNQQAMQGMGNQGLQQMLGQMQLLNQTPPQPPPTQGPIPGL